MSRAGPLTAFVIASALLGGCGAPMRTDPVAAFHPEGRTEGDRIATAHGPAAERRPTSGEERLREERRRRHAQAHRAAALKRHEWHVAACEGVSEDDRARCPFGEPAGEIVVRDIEGGVRLVVADGEGLDALVRRARCHIAHGALSAGGEMPGCPFYVPDVDVRPVRVGGRTALELTTRRPDLVRVLRARARAVVEGTGRRPTSVRTSPDERQEQGER